MTYYSFRKEKAERLSKEKEARTMFTRKTTAGIVGYQGRPGRTRRRVGAAAAMATLAVVLCACSSSAKSTTRSGATLQNVSLALDYTWQPYHAPFMYGIKQGFFKKEGINLSLVQGQGSSTTTILVGQGNYNFGFADTNAMVLGAGKGVPVESVQVIDESSAYATECFKSVGFTGDPKQLEGKSVILIPSESDALIFPAYLAANGVNPSGIHVVDASVSDKVTLFLAGKAQCMAGVLGEDTLEASLQSSSVGNAFPWSNYGIQLMGYSIIANKQTVQSDPGLVKRFVAATVASWKAACANPGAALQVFQSEHPEYSKPGFQQTYNEKNLPIVCSEINPPKGVSSTPLGAVNPSQWNYVVSTLRRYGGLSNGQPATAYYTNAFTATR